MLIGFLVLIVGAIAAFAATELVRRNAVRLGTVQAPNARSSHKVPTPSGGGVGIVLGGSMAATYATVLAPWPNAAVLVLALLVAALGFADDRRPLPARVRLPAQLVLLALALVATVPLEALQRQVGVPLPAVALGAVAVVAAGYWLNLFNFMDGIDGIAAAQAIFMSLAAIVLMLLHGRAGDAQPVLWMLGGLAAASLGFLALNWPPAKIFMGDAGSTYLGFTVAVLALISIAAGWLTPIQWAILGAAFITDASVTLARRLLRRERVFEAHRRHAYQALSRRWGAHRPVTLAFIGINLVWLLPLAALAALPGWAVPALLLAYVPLGALALHFGAGAPEAAVSSR